MKNIGIWLDKRSAHIITSINNNESIETINSDIEDFNITSNKFKGGANEIVHDSKHLEREKHQLKAYFKSIATKIEKADAIVIFGPTQIGEKLNKELFNYSPNLIPKIKGVKKADSMTENQVKSWVRDFYK